jgi:plasmid stabilization system protein ParE
VTRDVVVAPEAERQVRAVDAWWRDNRPAAPDLFEQELRDAFATLATHASIGKGP